MSAVKAFPTIVVIFLVTVVFVGLGVVGDETVGNSNLDAKSQDLIIDLQGELGAELNENNLTLVDSALANGSGFEGQDPFVQQFLENKESANTFESFTGKLKAMPDLFLISLNDDIGEEQLSIWKTIILAFIGILITVIALVAIFGEGRFT